jgi:uncharacterized repeat protein (TIGR03803 family)
MTALLLAAVNTRAVVFTNFYEFNFPYSFSIFPNSGLLSSGNTLYGTTPWGGSYGYGTVFKVNTDGTGFTNLYNFDETNGDYPFGTLVLSGNTLYGTTSGFNDDLDQTGDGTVFSVNTDGTDFTNLYIFNSVDGQLADGSTPFAGLTLCGNTLYGTTALNDILNGNSGTIFAINTDGTGFTNLYSFTETILGAENYDSIGTNSDGAWPIGVLTLSGNTLYGTAQLGGIYGFGAVFAVNIDGTDFTNLHSFSQLYTDSSLVNTNSDGINPVAGLILSGNTLYGTTQGGGFYGSGTVFAVNTDGTGFTNLYNFSATSPHTSSTSISTNSDGADPAGGLVLCGNTLYGTTAAGGANGAGTVFAVDTDGTGFTNLYTFTALSALAYYGGTNSDGAYPFSGLVLSGNTLYGTTTEGGSSGGGTVYTLSLGPITLNIQLNGNNVILTWGNPAFLLQAATNIGGVYATVPGATSPYTNTISGIQQFYRLIN